MRAPIILFIVLAAQAVKMQTQTQARASDVLLTLPGMLSECQRLIEETWSNSTLRSNASQAYSDYVTKVCPHEIDFRVPSKSLSALPLFRRMQAARVFSLRLLDAQVVLPSATHLSQLHARKCSISGLLREAIRSTFKSLHLHFKANESD
jgi:hypothetical protein